LWQNAGDLPAAEWTGMAIMTSKGYETRQNRLRDTISKPPAEYREVEHNETGKHERPLIDNTLNFLYS
jgi:hypothetical protein